AEVDGRINLAVRIKASEPPTGNTAEGGKVTSNQNLAIELDGQRINRIICARACILQEGIVERSIGVEAREVITVGSIDGGEGAANENSAVRLNCDYSHGFISAESWVKCSIQRAVGV